MNFHSQKPAQSDPMGFTVQNKLQVQKKRESFVTQIRRSKLNEKFKTMRQDLKNERQKFDNVQNQSKDCKIFQNSHQNQHYQYSLVDAIFEKQINLIKISLKNDRMKNEIEQRFSSQNNGQINWHQPQKLEQQPLNYHIQLYSSISHDIQQNPQKYQKMDKRKQEQLIDFWLRFLERNKYKETADHKQYHRTIIQFLTLFTSVIYSPDLREKILIWVEGTQSMALIFNCIPDQFMNFFKYGKIYDIILKGLTNKNFEIKSEAIDVLLKAIRMSDYDDISQLLQQRSEIFTKLLKFFQNQQIIKNVKQQKQQTIQCVIKAAYCVNLFLTTYDDYVLNCLKQGAGYVGAWLICQKNNMLIKQGLQIFSIIAGIQDEQYREQAQNFLLTNVSIDDSGVWYKLGRNYDIVGHSDLQVRNFFVTFISTFFAYSNLPKIMQLNEKFRYPHGYSLVDVLIQMFKHNDDLNILLNILNAIQSLLYYNWSDQEYNEEYSEEYLELYQQDQNSFRPQIIDDFQKHVIRNKMEKQSINIKMENLSSRQNIDQSLKKQINLIFDLLKYN